MKELERVEALHPDGAGSSSLMGFMKTLGFLGLAGLAPFSSMPARTAGRKHGREPLLVPRAPDVEDIIEGGVRSSQVYLGEAPAHVKSVDAPERKCRASRLCSGGSDIAPGHG